MHLKESIIYNLYKLRYGQLIINEHNKSGNFSIPIHLAIGHEAIALAVDNNITKDDRLILSHRNMIKKTWRDHEQFQELQD